MTPELNKFLGKVPSGELKLNFSGPAGGSRTTRVHSPPKAGIQKDSIKVVFSLIFFLDVLNILYVSIISEDCI